MRSLESFRSPSLLRSLLQSASRSGHESPFLWMSQIEMAGTAPFGRLVSNTAIVARSVRYQTDWNWGSPLTTAILILLATRGPFMDLPSPLTVTWPVRFAPFRVGSGFIVLAA